MAKEPGLLNSGLLVVPLLEKAVSMVRRKIDRR